MPASVVKDGDWELDHELSDISIGRFVWKLWDGEKLVVRTDYHVDKLLEVNKAQRNETAGQRWGDWRHVASIPLNLYHSCGFAEAHRGQDGKFISHWLNDPDNVGFRTFEGNV